MAKPLKYLPLPGVNQKDPNFYESGPFYANGPYIPTSKAPTADADPNTGNLDTADPESVSDPVPWTNMRSE